MSVKHGGGRGVFIEKQRGHVGGNGPMRRSPHDALGGDGVRGTPSPLPPP